MHDASADIRHSGQEFGLFGVRVIGICLRCDRRYKVPESDAKHMVEIYVMRNRQVPKHPHGVCDKCWAKMLAKGTPKP